ncbi:hypothetical protein MHYP_G00070440 [Metynnis hypsauchen]
MMEMQLFTRHNSALCTYHTIYGSLVWLERLFVVLERQNMERSLAETKGCDRQCPVKENTLLSRPCETLCRLTWLTDSLGAAKGGLRQSASHTHAHTAIGFGECLTVPR